jgi:dolichol-phosphate hexosyltransferase
LTEEGTIFPHRERISLVIPVLNEEGGLEELIGKSCPYAGEVIVIDGHSTDRSAAVAAACGARVLYDNRKGKGDALRCAAARVTRDITVFMDADGSHDPSDIPRLVRPIIDGTADHVTGSRLLGGSSELHGGFDEFLRLAGSSFISACISRRFKVRISDSQNGFRAVRTEVLRRLDLRENITTIEQEMIIKTLKAGFRLEEVPTHEYKRRFSRSHIRVGRVWFRYGYSLVKYLCF